MNDLTWAFVLLAFGLLLVVAEIFVPSGGLIGLLALGLLCLSLWNAFRYSSEAGWLFILADLGLLPVALIVAVNLWPKTPFAKATFLRPPDADDLAEPPNASRMDHLIGELGKTLTPMRPSGMVSFEGRRLDGIAEEGMIDANVMVQAVRKQGAYLIVRLAKDIRSPLASIDLEAPLNVVDFSDPIDE
jgi:membrane-bound ClpP family serine protease